MESGKYEWEQYDNHSRKTLGYNPFPKGGHLLGNHDSHQGEIRKKAYSNAPSIKVTLSTIPDLLPRGERSTVFWKQAGVVDAIMTNGEVWW
jgi:hypothetical protein